MKLFPAVEGSNLEGKKFKIPFDLDGELNLVIIPFLQYQQFTVDKWTNLLSSLEQKYSSFRYYEIPTLSIGYIPMRLMIDGGMRAGIPSIQTRNRTITIYINKKKFKKKLGIKTEETIYLFLLKNNEILWEESGSPSTEKIEDLEQNIKKYQ